MGVRVLPSVPCRNQKGLRNDLEALFNSTASKGGMNRTDRKPRANNRLFRGEKGVCWNGVDGGNPLQDDAWEG